MSDPRGKIVMELGSTDPKTRLDAARALGKAAVHGTNISFAIQALTKALSDENSDVRVNAAWALGNGALQGANITVAIPALVKALFDEEGDVQWNAREALEKATANPKSRDAALSALAKAVSDENPCASKNAANALMGSIEKHAPMESLSKLEAHFRECHRALKIKCRYGRDGKMQLAGVLYPMLFNRIAKKRDELAPKRDILLDDIPKAPKKGEVFRELRRALAHV
jgi:hypothetical protein